MCDVFLILGIIEKMQQLYRQNHHFEEIYVCSPTDHFVSQGHNCGFRNLQMLLSCLMQNAAYLHQVFSGRCGWLWSISFPYCYCVIFDNKVYCCEVWSCCCFCTAPNSLIRVVAVWLVWIWCFMRNKCRVVQSVDGDILYMLNMSLSELSIYNWGKNYCINNC